MISQKTKPRISIIVPVYGTEKYFDRCIDSLLKQSYSCLEIIIVNDGSPGDIQERVKKYMTDSRVVFIDNENNQGLLRTRVCGAKRATGDYIAFVDSDDYVSEDFYRVLLTKACETDADITIGRTVWEKKGYRYVYNYHENCFCFEELLDENIKKAYFSQETQCYSWHTIWNKLYKKSLWDCCMSEYQTVKDNVIMTEDIYFSSILFYNAKKVVHTNSEAYFYCSNEKASTNSNELSISRFEKNLHDINYVFDKVESYLQDKRAAEYVLKGFHKGRSHYARMWKCLAENSFQGESKDRTKQLVDSFCDDYGTQNVQHDYYFESVQTPWNGGLEYIKKQIREGTQEYVSFDVFDTLIARPFYEPSDIFKLMNPLFSDKVTNSILFDRIRQEGEKAARRYYENHYEFEDISINEIYDYISTCYGIDKKIVEQMKQYECELELEFCQPRYAGKELFEYARAIGKKVILISDMYLDSDIIKKILDKSSVYGYEKLFLSCECRKLKYNGKLFEEVLKDLNIDKNSLIHIGDTWNSDIEGSSLLGIKNIFFPKAIEVFENKIQGCTTNRCANIAFTVCGGNRDTNKIKENLGYRCMIAMSANMYFDNPYRTFHAESDFNLDSYFIGYYLLGMHMLGISKWLKNLCVTGKYEQLVFLARDGYLPMMAFKEYLKCETYKGQIPEIVYMQASRKSVMPVLLKERLNFYQLPVEYRAHTPMTLTSVLSFAADESMMEKERLVSTLRKADINSDAIFESKEALHKYIEFYFKYIYDSEKHKKEIQKVKRYYSKIRENSLVFDMGYSGRIQNAICEASGKIVDAAFIHEDYQTSIETKRYSGFTIHNFYDYRPKITGLIREHIFSNLSGSCVGFEEKNGRIIEKFEESRHTYPDCYVVESMQSGAVHFVQDFVSLFGKHMSSLDYSTDEVSLPFEGFLRYPNPTDMHIFSASYFEDLVFGARDEINIEEFAVQNLTSFGWPLSQPIEEKTFPAVNQDAERITTLINHSSQLKRGLIWIMLDWSFFTEKFKINIRRLTGKKERNREDGL